MTVSRKEVDQMANFMKALSTAEDVPDQLVRVNTEAHLNEDAMTPNYDNIATSPRPVDGSVLEMKRILERFHHAADNTVQESKTDRGLREAMMTERTPKGSRIGAWNIDVREEGKRKFYNVVAEDGVTTIASDLLLYEAAYGLVRILNNGGRLNSKEAIGLLRNEQDYASAINEAVLYKHYLTKKPHDSRAAIFEARYSAAKYRAVDARNKVIDFSHLF